jgi:hypothetical protein
MDFYFYALVRRHQTQNDENTLLLLLEAYLVELTR